MSKILLAHSGFLRRLVLAFAMLLLPLAFVSTAHANWPSGPITIIAPFNPGGAIDRLARAVAPHLSEELGVPVVVVNRPGAGGLLGHTFFLNQPDDGNTLLMTSATAPIALNILVQNATFQMEDFAFINMPRQEISGLMTASTKPFNDFNDLVNAIRANPGRISIGVINVSADLVNLMLTLEALGLSASDVRIVTYDGGGPVRTAVAGGTVDAGIIGAEGSLTVIDRVRTLAVYGEEALGEPWNAPAINAVLAPFGAEMTPVSGSISGFAAAAGVREKHPERWARIVAAFEAIAKNEEITASFREQGLWTNWLGPDRSTEIVMQSYSVLAEHAHLLRGQ
jgi:putative tricarboxylic transport membrane protein